MAAKKIDPWARERRHLGAVLAPLIHSVRGQIFLTNVADALPLIDPKNVRRALLTVLPDNAKSMHEVNYLAHLKGILQNPAFGLKLQNEVTSLGEFAADRWVVNVLPYVTYKARYEDSAAALRGHKPFDAKIGSEAVSFKVGASTAPFWWFAPRSSFPKPITAQQDAQGCRDLLGLVHYDELTPLVAMHMEVTAVQTYRPTIVEANPNARFRQIDPENPMEARWGRTVDLEKISLAKVGDGIGGVPELVAASMRLDAASKVGFFYLGKPRSDRSTTSMDQKFLDSILGTRKATAVLDEIVGAILK